MPAVVIDLGTDSAGSGQHDVFDDFGLAFRRDIHHLVLRSTGITDTFRCGIVFVIDLHVLNILRRQVAECRFRIVAEKGLPIDINTFDLRSVGVNTSVADLDARQLLKQFGNPVPGQSFEGGSIVDGSIPANNHGNPIAPHLDRCDLSFVLDQLHDDITNKILRIVSFCKRFITDISYGQIYRMLKSLKTFAAGRYGSHDHVFHRSICQGIPIGGNQDCRTDQRIPRQTVLHVNHCPGITGHYQSIPQINYFFLSEYRQGKNQTGKTQRQQELKRSSGGRSHTVRSSSCKATKNFLFYE